MVALFFRHLFIARMEKEEEQKYLKNEQLCIVERDQLTTMAIVSVISTRVQIP